MTFEEFSEQMREVMRAFPDDVREEMQWEVVRSLMAGFPKRKILKAMTQVAANYEAEPSAS